MVFPPDLPAQLAKSFGEGSKVWGIILIVGVLIGIGIVASSGLIDVFFPGSGGIGNWMSSDTASTIIVVLLLVGTVYIVIGTGGGTSGGKT